MSNGKQLTQDAGSSIVGNERAAIDKETHGRKQGVGCSSDHGCTAVVGVRARRDKEKRARKQKDLRVARLSQRKVPPLSTIRGSRSLPTTASIARQGTSTKLTPVRWNFT